MKPFPFRIAIALVVSLMFAKIAAAQTSSVTGTAKDMSGAVLPGVSVEIASPALIEKSRTAVTDESGRYRVIELVPGTYTVTFTLPGFAPVKFEGIELNSDFVANVNAEMKVGTQSDSVTVTEETPIVDTQSITTRTVMTREVLDVLPTGRNIQAIGIMIPGTSLSLGGGGALSRDVGGSGGLQQSPLIYRGSGDAVQTIDGIRLNNLCASGQFSGVYWNDASLQEISYVTGADSAGMAQGGVRVSMVPKEGTNAFHGSVIGNFTYGPWQTGNLRSNLHGDLTNNQNNVLTNVSVIKKIWDFNPGFGGPIVKNKLWFYGTFRHQGVNKTVADSYFNKLGPTSLAYSPDLSRPAIDDGHIVSRAGRISWQVSDKDKITVYHDWQSKYRNHWGVSSLISPEASAIQVTPTSFVHVDKWTRTQSPKLVFDAGFGIYDQEYTELYQPSVTGSNANVFDLNAIANSTVYSITEQTTGKITGAWNSPADHYSLLRTYSASASYVTGGHVLNIGATFSNGRRRLVQRWTGDLTMTFSQGLPQSVTLRTPLDQRDGIKGDYGLFAQEKWTIKRVTLNGGLRYDGFRGQVLSEDLPASRWNPATHFDGFYVQSWKDISPRVGIALDLFGNGKTAVRTSFARYVNGEEVATVVANNPETTVGTTDLRNWKDNGDFTIFNPDGSVQTSELGPTTNVNFGKVIPSTTTTDPSVLNGWGKRPYNWEYQFSVQHQLLKKVSLNFAYYRRSFGNQTITDNQLTDPSSYDGPFCIKAPLDPNLPGGGGYDVCGLYDIKPTSQGQVKNVRKLASTAGGIPDIYKGFDVSIVGRFAKGTFLQGGINAQTRHFNSCNAPFIALVSQIDSPEKRFCDQIFPYRPDLKLSGSHTLPWDVIFSGTYQFSQGPNILATWAVPNSIIAPALGRNLAAGLTATKSVSLIEPGKYYGENLNQLDLRLSKRIKFESVRFRVDLDLYNVLNSDWPFTVNTTFSTAATSQWLRPTNVLQGRLFKMGAQFDF